MLRDARDTQGRGVTAAVVLLNVCTTSCWRSFMPYLYATILKAHAPRRSPASASTKEPSAVCSGPLAPGTVGATRHGRRQSRGSEVLDQLRELRQSEMPPVELLTIAPHPASEQRFTCTDPNASSCATIPTARPVCSSPLR